MLLCFFCLFSVAAEARYISVDSSNCLRHLRPEAAESAITSVGAEQSDTASGTADASDNRIVLKQSAVFDDTTPLVVVLDHSEIRGKITADFSVSSIGNSQTVMEADSILFSYDRGKSWNKPENEPVCTFSNTPADWDGVLFVKFPHLMITPDETVLIIFTDEHGGTSSVAAERLTDPPFLPDAGEPWLLENDNTYHTQKRVRLNIPAGFQLTRTLEHLKSSNGKTLFQKVPEQTAALLMHTSEDKTEDMIWAEPGSTQGRPAAGQYRLTYKLSFEEVTVNITTLIFFINYSLV